MAGFEWMTTYPSGRAHTHGADDGQTGWRIHLVDPAGLYESETFIRYRAGPVKTMRGPALCGMRPRTGWGLDLFIDKPCARCVKAAGKRGITPPRVPK